MDLELNGKRALVTGSTSGIGEAVAEQLAAEGVRVVVHGRRADAAETIAGRIRAAGGEAIALVGDLGSDDGVLALATRIDDELGGIDVLVNNASVYPQGPWQDSKAKEWVAVYNTNVGGLVRITQALLPGMRARKWGRVINMASTVGTLPYPVMGAYCATKAAFLNISAGLAKEAALDGVTVNSISPGLVLTPGVERMLRDMAREQAWGDDWDEIERRGTQVLSPNPVGRIGRPKDIAYVVAMLASPRAGYCNGANYRVDGGFVPIVN